jgi:hypothetical protein
MWDECCLINEKMWNKQLGKDPEIGLEFTRRKNWGDLADGLG